jgi:AraC-like DNA-binding protein
MPEGNETYGLPDVVVADLDASTLWCSAGIRVNHERYHATRYPWCRPWVHSLNAITLMRKGTYRRRADGIEHVVDPNSGCFLRSGEEVSVANVTGEPEALTHVVLSEDLLTQLFVEPMLPSGSFAVTPDVDLGHRMLLRAIDVGADDAEIERRAIGLAATVVTRRRPDVVRGGRAMTEQSRRSLVNDSCEILYALGGDVSLQELARRVGSSPFHLSRVFRALTGMTVSQYRLRLRVHRVLDRLAEGEENLAALAQTAGFADHSHMTRTVVAQLGEAPSALRRLLRGQQDLDSWVGSR